MRIGQGFDIHALVPGRPLILGGVGVPHNCGLQGHSDADVIVHAIIDALLGASSLGDIGKHFPDDDIKYKDSNSIELLKKSWSLIEFKYELANIDSTIIAEKPKLQAYIPQMRNNIALAINVDVDKVNIKATTAEKMGFIGKEQGIAAMATALLLRKSQIF